VVRQELGIGPDAFVIGQVARLQPYKGQMHLINAAPAILAARPDAHILICGYVQRQEAYRQRLLSRIEALGLGHAITLVSYPGAVGDIWGVIDLHAHPTERDSSPIALMEAMSLGKPSVSTDVGGIAEILVDGRSGRVLPPGDLAGITDALVDLATDAEKRAQFGAEAHARYQAQHLPEMMTRRMEAIYRAAHERAQARRRGH
jgi:glycosyltransferase involved in cell wall biosynthesis